MSISCCVEQFFILNDSTADQGDFIALSVAASQ